MVVTNKVASRYAKSLLLLAEERNELEQIKNEMELLNKIIGENPDLKIMLRSPLVKKDKKIQVLNLIFKDGIGSLVSSFIKIIAHNNREHLLYYISGSFVDLYNEMNKIITANVTSAVALDNDMRDKIRNIISVLDNSEILIDEKVNEDLIGGLVLRVGDQQVDASVSRQLRLLKNELITEEYISKL